MSSTETIDQRETFKKSLARFVELEQLRREEESKLEAIKQERDALEASLLEEFTELGMQSTKMDDLTVYVQRSVYASAPDGDALCGAMTENGYGEMVKRSVNSQSLASFVREFEKDEQPIPEWLAPLVKVSEVFKLRTRKS